MSLNISLLPRINYRSQTTLKHQNLEFNSPKRKETDRLRTNPLQNYANQINNTSIRKSKIQKREKIRQAILQSFSSINRSNNNTDQCIIQYHKQNVNECIAQNSSKEKPYKKDSLAACKKDLYEFKSLIKREPKPLIPKLHPLLVNTPQYIVHRLRAKTIINSKQIQDIRIIVNQPNRKRKKQIQDQSIQQRKYKSIDHDNLIKKQSIHNFQNRSSSLQHDQKSHIRRIHLNDYDSYERNIESRRKQMLQKIKGLTKKKKQLRSKKYHQLSLLQKIYDSTCSSRLQQLANKSDLSKVHKKIQTKHVQKCKQKKAQYKQYLQQFSGWDNY